MATASQQTIIMTSKIAQKAFEQVEQLTAAEKTHLNMVALLQQNSEKSLQMLDSLHKLRENLVNQS